MARPGNSNFMYSKTSRTARVLARRSVGRASLPIRPHASRTDTPLLKETARATLPWLTKKYTNTRPANGITAKSKVVRLTDPPSAEYTNPPRPEASINWAVLNQTLTRGLSRTNLSAINAVTPPMNIGQGCLKRATEAMIGINATEVRTLATGIVNEKHSLTMPRIAKAANAFQN